MEEAQYKTDKVNVINSLFVYNLIVEYSKMNSTGNDNVLVFGMVSEI